MSSPENIHPTFGQLLGREAKEALLKQRGSVVWLYGLSGSGKSTLTRLLFRFYDVQQGEIRLDDKPIRNLRLRGLLSYAIKRNNYTDITDETFYDRQLGELGDPRWQGQISANLSTDNVDFGYRMRYIGKQVLGNYETYFSVQGRPPLNPDATPFAYYPDVTYHDFRVTFLRTGRE